jgi:hypothetical protein
MILFFSILTQNVVEQVRHTNLVEKNLYLEKDLKIETMNLKRPQMSC